MSIRLVSILNRLLFAGLLIVVWGLAHSAEAATLSLSPSTGVYTAGNTFTARVVVNTAGDAINAAEGNLTFDSDTLSVVNITRGSIFSLWAVEPTYSNSAGTISFGGGSPTGYTGGSGTVLTITFRAKTAGTGKVSFTNGSVLAADGRGTNVLTSLNSGSYTIVAAEVAPEPEVIEYIAPANTPAAPIVNSSTHTDPAGWYQADVAELTWDIPGDVTAVRTLWDEHAGSIPTKVYEPPITTITLEALEEGEQYFHLQFRNTDGWGRVTHYRLARDSQAPTSFIIELAETDPTNPAPVLLLHAKDDTSGIAHYTISIDGAEPYEFVDETGSSTVTLPELSPGSHSVVVTAYDYAGNSLVASQSFTILAFDRPQFTEYPDTLNEGVIPVIKGVTRPQATVSVIIRTLNSSTEQEYTVVSDEAGVFTIIPDHAFTVGVYEMVAVATDQYGAQSEQSEAVRIAVQQPGYIAIGSLAVSVLSILVPLVALVGLLLLIVVYFMRRIRSIGIYVRDETVDALAVVERQFKALQKTITTEESALVKSRRSKKLTKAEAHLITSMRSELETAQAQIKAEVAEVDDIVNK